MDNCIKCLKQITEEECMINKGLCNSCVSKEITTN